MRRNWLVGLGLGAVAALAACGDEDPTGVGSGLLGPGVRTFEVIYDAAEFLERDTTFAALGGLDDAGFRMAAHGFDGQLDARTLVSLVRPEVVTYTPPDGSSVTDSVGAAIGGTLVVVVDTVASSPGPIDLELVQLTESWDRATATWEMRFDTAGLAEPWQTPGGGGGAIVGGATWTSGDTLEIVLDSAAVAVWEDSTAAAIGGLIRSTTAGSRLFIQAMTFRFDVVPVEADTVLEVGGVAESKIILTPAALDPPSGVLRVGGTPSWRSMLRFLPLSDLRVPCGPDQPAECTLPLQDVTINLASLIFDPLPGGGHRVERPMRVEARAVLQGPGTPLIRSPLTQPVGPPTDSLGIDLFEGVDPDAPVVRVPITSYLQFHTSPDDDPPPPLWLALTAVFELSQFGHATLAGVGSDRPPRLRLLVSVPDEVLLR